MSDKASNEPFTAEEVDGMVRHMNEEHADSVLAYAQHFGEQDDATEATLTGITPSAMQLCAETPSGRVELKIPFDRPLTSSHDAHMKLIGMSKRAKRSLAG
jgi:putative heme iron utilization protein